MSRFLMAVVWAGVAAAPLVAVRADDPMETVRQSQQVLGELVAIPGNEIPQRLLAEAQGVAIIPRVVKVGFVAGLRRGHGVVMIRDAEGDWSLPQFIRLTGGSVGWQAGIQGTDVVLVFTTRKSVEGLMKGKFTVGADASAAAGPVGRNAAAATDMKLGAEIYSYSRSRGLFLGVSLDGSALEIDQVAHTAFYGSASPQPPVKVPDPAVQLRQHVVDLTGGGMAPVEGAAAPVAVATSTRLEALRQALAQNAGQLHALLPGEWRQYLAMPQEVVSGGQPAVAALTGVEQRFAQVAASPNYAQLAQRPEFQATHELLREYVVALSAAQPTLQLPLPPVE